ncbi:winged helix-turn-helix domain-containing protein [Paenibacillus sp. BR2-3]|uniref:winged helix-turn-helix domain-containing protein n=1 Tax=Paenibacillus sp. BR2-3 TaxID=3048494 RepID=UPI003977DB7B
MYLELNESEYKVTAEGITVELFAKEFALLQFMYRNRGRTFSREQLLDKVWPLEYPAERTVDDHIYRLRKKLGSLQGLDIKTLRGFGYSLTVPNSHTLAAAHPTAQDAELRETMREVFVKYHQYGQGRSMLILARQQDVLGYEMDSFYSVYVHFVQGDLEWLLNTSEVPMGERLYWLLLFFMFSGEPEGKLAYCEQALEKKLMSPSQHREMEILNILDLYTVAGVPDKALQRLELTHKVIAELQMEKFRLPVAISEMFAHLAAGTQNEELNRMATAIEELLLEKPFLREIGSYKVVKGMWALRRKEWREAENLMDEGLGVLDMSGFIPLRLLALHRIVHYCRRFQAKEALEHKYTRLFEEEQEQLGLNRLMKPLEAAIHNYLHAL